MTAPKRQAPDNDGVQSRRDRKVARMSEGVRTDLEQFGETIDPVTGKRLTRADLP